MTSDDVQRTILPIPDLAYTGTVTYEATSPDTSFPPIRRLLPPEGAPNVLVILIDDVGFGASSAFGGPVRDADLGAPRRRRAEVHPLPHHGAVLADARRAALRAQPPHRRDGRDHRDRHLRAGLQLGAAEHLPAAWPRSSSSTATAPRSSASATRCRCGRPARWARSTAGRRPGNGFEYFYGFLGGETNQWYPAIYENTTPIEPWGGPDEGYHFMDDMTDKAIAWTRQQKALAPDKPFFMYFAPGATHAPHHVPKEWADRYRGRFAAGWDAVREETFARQKELGVIPADAVLTERNEGIPAWDDMSAKIKPVLEREMEVYAGFLSYADHHTGRLIDALEEMGILDDTLVYVIIGDNGASAEGNFAGTTNEAFIINHMTDMEDEDYLVAHIDDIGTPNSYNHYAIGWAHAMDTPYQWTKQVASHWGGTRNGTIVRWPSGIEARARCATSSPTASTSARRSSRPPGSPSRAPSTASPNARWRARACAIASTILTRPNGTRPSTSRWSPTGRSTTTAGPPSPSTRTRGPARRHGLDDDVWELYNVDEDWTQSNDLAAEHPEKLAELQRLFLIQAARFNVLPLDTRSAERFNPDLVGRPTLIRGNSQTLWPGMKRLSENSAINTKNKSHTVSADITVPDGGAEGVIIAQGGRFGGWSLFAKDGTTSSTATRCSASRASPSPPTRHCRQATSRCAPSSPTTAAGSARAAPSSLFTGDTKIGEGRVDRTVPFQFSFDETVDVGCDTALPGLDEYAARRQRVHRHDPPGAHRHRRRQPRPPHRPAARDAGRDVEAMTQQPASPATVAVHAAARATLAFDDTADFDGRAPRVRRPAAERRADPQRRRRHRLGPAVVRLRRRRRTGTVHRAPEPVAPEPADLAAPGCSRSASGSTRCAATTPPT